MLFEYALLICLCLIYLLIVCLKGEFRQGDIDHWFFQASPDLNTEINMLPWLPVFNPPDGQQ